MHKKLISTLSLFLSNQVGAIGVVHRNSSLALKTEAVENVYEPPVSGADYIEVLADGLELTKTTEELAREILSGTIESEASRKGIPEITGSIGVEFRASKTPGTAPQALDVQMQSLLGGKKIEVGSTTTVGNTATVLTFASHNFTVGSIVLIKEAGAFECRPVIAIDATTITLAFALENGAPSDGVDVESTVTYYSDSTNAKSYSAEYNIGNEIRDAISGLRSVSGSIENWTVGTIPTMNFAVNGLSLTRTDNGQSFAPDFSNDALPPVALEACLWISGNKLSYSELGLSVENEITPITDACAADGKIGQRAISQTTIFSANPYMDDTTFQTYSDYDNNADVSVFFFASNPSTTPGEFSEVVAVWLPQAKITAHPTGDANGLATDAMEIKAHRSNGNDTVFISMI